MPRGVGDWRLVDTGQDFVSWRRELRKYGDEQAAVVWVEDSAAGDGYIAWAHVEPAGGDSHTIVSAEEDASRETAMKRAQDWMSRNPEWPSGSSTGLGGFDWGL